MDLSVPLPILDLLFQAVYSTSKTRKPRPEIRTMLKIGGDQNRYINKMLSHRSPLHVKRA